MIYYLNFDIGCGSVYIPRKDMRSFGQIVIMTAMCAVEIQMLYYVMLLFQVSLNMLISNENFAVASGRVGQPEIITVTAQ